MKLGKVETGETKIRIEQDVFNREGREVTRRGAEKMKLLKVRNLETEFRIGPIASGLWPLTSNLSPLTFHLGAVSVSPFVAGSNQQPGSILSLNLKLKLAPRSPLPLH